VRERVATAGDGDPYAGADLANATGVAEFAPDQEPADLVASADQALMLAKGSGLFDAPQAHG
jgi:hypothetical protein